MSKDVVSRFDHDFSLTLDTGTAVSDIDGRYRRITKPFANYFSEAGLQRYRTAVEVEYLLHLSDRGVVRTFKETEKKYLKDLVKGFSPADFKTIKKIEKETNHDVKAVEYFVKRKLPQSMSDVKEMVHFALASEDTSNLALSLALKNSTQTVLVPAILEPFEKIVDFADRYKSTPMLARTHGQPASPTTLGKEFANFAYRIDEGIRRVADFRFPGKLNGATGNFNAHVAAIPNVDWEKFSRSFVKDRLGLEYIPMTTQILPHDRISRFFREIVSLNDIVEGVDADVWRYISDDWFKLKVEEGETGSSTMPHKVNPIEFENSEGNLPTANAMFNFLASKLQKSRLQRDLTDSTVKRKYGAAMGWTLIGYSSLSKGMDKIEPNIDEIAAALVDSPEVISEPLQQTLRTKGYDKAYEKVKGLTRGKKVTLKDIHKFISGLDIDENTRKRLLALRPEIYTGYAERLTTKAVKDFRKTIGTLRLCRVTEYVSSA